jgi:hypothetical protein
MAPSGLGHLMDRAMIVGWGRAGRRGAGLAQSLPVAAVLDDDVDVLQLLGEMLVSQRILLLHLPSFDDFKEVCMNHPSKTNLTSLPPRKTTTMNRRK